MNSEIYIDPDGEKCKIILKGNYMSMVEYSNGYICFWLSQLLIREV
jgi:hypothetical protein